MKRPVHIRSLSSAVLLACLALPAPAITLPTIEDTTSTSSKGVQRIVKLDNTSAVVYVKGTGATPKHALLMFNLGDVPTADPAAILSARLRIYFTVVTSPGALTVHQITGTWDEASTLATQPEPAFVSTAAGTIVAGMVKAHDYATVDVTSVVKAWFGGAVNEGLLLKGDPTANVTLASKERKGGGYPAELEIELVGTAGSGTPGAGSVTTIQLADTAVTTVKLADSAVTPAKLNLLTGNVGIGTASPAFRLDVTGTARAGSLLTTQQAGLEMKPYGTTAGQTSEIRLDALTGANFVGFKAPDTIATSRVYTLPAADGAAGTFLSTNGTGLLTWAAAAGGGGGGAVTSVAGRTGAVTLSAPDIGGLGALATQNSVTNITGNAGTATALATGHTISVSGDLTYASPSFNGSADVTAVGTLATVNSNIGPFGSSTLIPIVTVNAKGLVTAVSTVAAAAPTGVALLAGGNAFTGNQTIASGNLLLSAGNFQVGAGATGSTPVEVNGALSLYDNGSKTHNAGISTEISGSLINFGVNDSNQNRFGGAFTAADQGGYFRVDSRNGNALFQFAGRAGSPTSTAAAFYLLIDATGNVSIPVGNLITGTAGNVGIGVTDPTTKLTVSANVTKTTVATTRAFAVTTNESVNDPNQHPFGLDIRLTGAATLANRAVRIGTGDLNQADGGSLLLEPLGGHVGINTTDASLGALVVGGSASRTRYTSTVGYYGPDTSLSNTTDNHSSGLNSIYAAEEIVAKSFVAFSDERIKNIQGHSDSAEDLRKLLGLEVTDYLYKDVIAKGHTPQKKVIAQQVEKVFPQAVSQRTDVVPDIYRSASTKDGWVELATNLKVGERVKLIGEKEDGIHEVLEVRAGAFRTAFQPAGGRVFVYGREVNDFRAVDYEAIAMLNVSATQELAHQLAAKDAEIARLGRELAALQARDEARLTRLESALEAAQPARPVRASLRLH